MKSLCCWTLFFRDLKSVWSKYISSRNPNIALISGKEEFIGLFYFILPTPTKKEDYREILLLLNLLLIKTSN